MGKLFTFQIYVLFSVFIYFLNKTKQKKEMKGKKNPHCVLLLFLIIKKNLLAVYGSRCGLESQGNTVG